MSKPFRLEGIWWTDCGEVDNEGGTVSYEPGDTPELQLIRNSRFADAFRDVEYPTIYGKLITGEYVTFTDPFPMRRRQSANGTAVLELATNLLYAGPETIPFHIDFRSAEIVVPSLSAWLMDRPFDRDIDNQDGSWVSSASHISRTHFDEFVTSTAGGFRLRMSSMGSSAEEQDRYELNNVEMLHISPRSKKGVNYFQNTAWDLMQYFSLMAKHPFEIRSLVLRTKKSKKENDQISDPRFALVYPTRRSKNTIKLKRSDVIFHQSEVTTRKRTTLRRFFSADAGLSTALSIFHAIRLEPPSVDFRLILLVQVYEAAFSEKDTGRVVPRAKFREVKRMMREAIPQEFIAENPDFVKAIDRALGHANSKPLKEKMKTQLDSMDKEVVRRIFVTDHLRAIRSIVDTRNYVTHRTEGTRTPHVVMDLELINLTESLYWMIWYLLLNDLGFTKSRLSKKIIEHWSFDESNRSRVQLDTV